MSEFRTRIARVTMKNSGLVVHLPDFTPAGFDRTLNEQLENVAASMASVEDEIVGFMVMAVTPDNMFAFANHTMPGQLFHAHLLQMALYPPLDRDDLEEEDYES